MKNLTVQDNAWEFNDREMKRLDIGYEGKGILALRANLWFPYKYSVVEDVTVSYFKKGDTEPVFLEKIALGRPFPNKSIIAAVTKVGRKHTKWFIPVVFDSLSELYSIERIKIEWKLSHSILSKPTLYEYVIADYWVSAAKSEQKGVYGLWSYDTSCCDIVNPDKIHESPFSHDAGKLISEMKSMYDDFCLFDVTENDVDLLTEWHSGESVNIDNLISEGTLSSIALQAMANAVKVNTREDILVTYYRTKNVLLSDCGIIC